jgi:hypothetical protein
MKNANKWKQVRTFKLNYFKLCKMFELSGAGLFFLHLCDVEKLAISPPTPLKLVNLV